MTQIKLKKINTNNDAAEETNLMVLRPIKEVDLRRIFTEGDDLEKEFIIPMPMIFTPQYDSNLQTKMVDVEW